MPQFPRQTDVSMGVEMGSCFFLLLLLDGPAPKPLPCLPLQCLEYMQSANLRVMKSAYRLFVAVQTDASMQVQQEGHRALETPVGARALAKL